MVGIPMEERKKRKKEINISTPYLTKLKDMVLSIFSNEKVKVFVFGSRARGDNQHTSDIDIGFIPHGKINRKKVAQLKEAIEDLNIPYKVEIVDFSQASESFRKEALKEVIEWKD